MWKPEHPLANGRRGLRYPSDLSDAEWVLVAPLIPPARRGGRGRSINEHEDLNAIFYVLATGCQWQALPKDLPPKSTAHFYFQDWDGTLDRIHEALYVAVLEAAGQEASPSDAIIDSHQSAKAAQKGLIACSSGLRCGQEGHGPQTPHPRRYARSPARRKRSACQHSRPRRCPRSVAASAAALSFHRTYFRGRGLSGAENGKGCRRDRLVAPRNCQAI